MTPRILLGTLTVATTTLAAHAHGFAGDHMFISTLLIDDPNVADEASVPTFQFQDAGGGLSLQYSIRYLSAQVKDYGLPDFANKLTPVVELAWSSPASQPNNGTQTQYLRAWA